jgi:hypothetical protein
MRRKTEEVNKNEEKTEEVYKKRKKIKEGVNA